MSNEQTAHTPFLRFSNNPFPSFTPTAISASGTVANSGNPVVCLLTPVDGGGQLRAQANLPLPQTLLASVTGTNWRVTFTPPISGQLYSGTYDLSAAASGEGGITFEGNV